MSSHNEGKRKAISGALAVLALVLTVVASIMALPQAKWGPALICALVAALLMEGLSVSMTTAGYFSMATPTFFLVLFGRFVPEDALWGALPLLLAISVAGLCSVGRFFAPYPDGFGQMFPSRLMGFALNVLRVGLAGALMLGSVKSGLGILIGAVAGCGLWLAFDQFGVGLLMNAVEEQETAELWERVPPQAKAILALAPLAGVVGSGWVQSEVQASVLSVLGVSLLGMAFRGSVKYYIDEIKVRDQEELVMNNKALERREKALKEQLATAQAENKQYLEELGSVNTMADSLGASTKVDDAVEVVTIMIKTLRIPYNSCALLLYRQGTLTPVYQDTPYQNVLRMSHLLQLEEPVITQVVKTGKPRLEGNQGTSEGRIFKEERSVLCVPLVVNKETIGVVYVGSKNPNTHNEEHLKLLKRVAALAAPSIKTASLFEDKEDRLRNEQIIRAGVEAKNAQLKELQLMGQRMGATLKTSTMIQVVSESLRKITRAQSVILFIPGKEGGDDHALKADFADTPYDGYVNNLALRDDEGLLGKAIQMKTTLLVGNTEVSDLPKLLGSERSVVVAPLMISASDAESGDQEHEAEQELLGVLYVGAAESNALTEDHRNLIETVSYQTAMALKNARLYEQTQQQALTDGLTGLYTHRLFQEKLSQELAAAEKSKQQVVLVMVDCDNFKTYNDTLGHPAGDALLKEIASLLKDKARNTDIVSRYGGDEFAMLLRNTGKDEAVRLCESIREAFQLRFGGYQVQVTSSIGIACYPTDALTKKDLAKAADDALYVAKRGGRNRVSASPNLQARKSGTLVKEVLAR